MTKATAVAPANIAFIKYWGIRDEGRTLPRNPSISMTLERCVSLCTVESSGDGTRDRVDWMDPEAGAEPAPEAFAEGVRRHLDRLREALGHEGSFRVGTRNTFPTGAGMASSASGFTALALATAGALERTVGPEELSLLARSSGSGSAARSALGGYVEWPVPADGEKAACLAAAEHWDLRDVVAVVSEGPKEVSSREGHRRAPTSTYFEKRLEALPERLEKVRESIRGRDFPRLAEVVEEEAIELHLVAMSSRPPIYYWQPGTLEVLWRVRALRREGIPACFTMDAGPNVHVLCPPEAEERVARELEALPTVRFTIRDRVGSGPRLDEEHLF